jgi:hypothetical protein
MIIEPYNLTIGSSDCKLLVFGAVLQISLRVDSQIDGYYVVSSRRQRRERMDKLVLPDRHNTAPSAP